MERDGVEDIRSPRSASFRNQTLGTGEKTTTFDETLTCGQKADYHPARCDEQKNGNSTHQQLYSMPS